MADVAKMGKINPRSKEDLCVTTDTLTTIMNGNFEDFAQICASESGSQEFWFGGSPGHYLDLLQFYMVVMAKVVKANSDVIGAAVDSTIMPKDAFCANLFCSR